MASIIDVQDIVTEWGKYMDNGQNQTDIKSKLYEPSVYESLIGEKRRTKDLVVRSAHMNTSELLQAFQCKWTPKGLVSLTPNEIILQEVKIDFDITCTKDIAESWVGFLDDGNLDYSQKPLVRWLLDKYLYPQHREDRELASFNGVRMTPTDGTAGLAINAVDGFNTIIAKGITDGKITPIASGAWPIDPVQFVTALETWVKNIDPKVKRRLETFRMAPELVERLKVGNREKYNKEYQRMPENKLTHIFDTNFMFAEDLEAQRGSGRVWTTVQGNSVMVTKFSDNIDTFRVIEKGPRQVNVWTEYYLAYGFWVNDWVITNELS